jgi:4-amino-4-deoxychorismate lyase
MSLFFETIKIENSKIQNLKYHNLRLNQTIKSVYKEDSDINLYHDINIPDNQAYRCKVIYSNKIEQITLMPYVKRKFNSFKIIKSDLEYPYKSTNRSEIDELFKKRGNCDDIIICKDGLLRDTSIANIALYDGETWYTPKNPLLKGTVREKLIKNKIITEKEIKVQYIKNIVSFAIMNALVGFQEIKTAKFY